jgi:diguanylate cyclase (GGDEF)-like protein/PAS domain S-box-containing protein
MKPTHSRVAQHPFRSRLRLVLLLGFLAMLSLLAVSWLLYLSQVERFQHVLDTSRSAGSKMELITSLMEVARARTRLTGQMLATEDPFERDEIRMRLDSEASRFAQLRVRLAAMPLNAYELELLERNAEYVDAALPLQRQAADLAMSDDLAVLRYAQKILMLEVFPRQGQIIDNLMELFREQKRRIDQVTSEAKAEYARGVQLATLLVVGSSLVAILIAVYVVRKTTATERALQTEKERAQVTLRSIGDAVISTDALGRIEYMNPVAELLTGMTLPEATGKPLGKVFRAVDEANGRPIAFYVQALAQHGSAADLSDEIVLHDAHGRQRLLALTLAPIHDDLGRMVGVIMTFQDVTEARHMARKLEHQARHDVLTGLLNRHSMEERATQALDLYRGESSRHVMCVFDLDRFKLVNDSCGHAAGDELLRQLGMQLRAAVRRGDLLARMGGDEFAVFLLNTSLERAVDVAEKLLGVVREFRFMWEGKVFRVGASFGLVETPAGGVAQYEQLLQAADAACYRAKHAGRDRIETLAYDEVTQDAQRREGEWRSRITAALEHDDFELAAQDIVPLQPGWTGPRYQELLIRLCGPDGKWIPPMSFLPAAERHDLMTRIDAWVVQRVIRHLQLCPEHELVCTINLSAQSIGDPQFVTQVIQRVRDAGIAPARLCFELTETAASANLETARHFMTQVRDMGCRVALDDFGAGLSSVAHLKNLPVDLIKIDGHLVRQLLQDRTARVMVEAIHGIARALELTSVAEYVEDAATLAALRDIGIDLAQGFHCGAPRPLQCLEPRPVAAHSG